GGAPTARRFSRTLRTRAAARVSACRRFRCGDTRRPCDSFLQRWMLRADRLGALQLRTIPTGECGGRVVGRLKKLEQHVARSRRAAHLLVFEEELAELLVVERGGGRDGRRPEIRRLRRGVRVERGIDLPDGARPESRAD